VTAVTMFLLILGVLENYFWYPAISGGWSYHIDWFIHGISIFTMAWANLPVLLAYTEHLGLAILFIAGSIYTMKRPDKYLFFPVSLILIWSIYFFATEGIFYEIVRDTSLIAPIFYLLSIYGWLYLTELAQKRAWHKGWITVALLAMFASILMPSIQGIRKQFHMVPQYLELSGVGQGLNKLGFPWQYKTLRNKPQSLLLTTNQQIEGRFLLKALAKYPTCTFVSKILGEGPLTFNKRNVYKLMVFRKDSNRPKTFPYRDEKDLKKLLETQESKADCTIFYLGLDCNIIGGQPCRPENGRLISRVSFTTLFYNSEAQYGRRKPVINLELYRVK